MKRWTRHSEGEASEVLVSPTPASISSVSVAAPTLITATPPTSLAKRSWGFSLSYSDVASSICTRSWLIRPSISPGTSDDRNVVLVHGHFFRTSQVFKLHVLELDSEILCEGLAARQDRDAEHFAPCDYGRKFFRFF